MNFTEEGASDGVAFFLIYGRSSIGRVVVSKTIGCRFESCRPC